LQAISISTVPLIKFKKVGYKGSKEGFVLDAVCGTTDYAIQVQYSGNSSCLARLFISNVQQNLTAAQSACGASLFTTSCQTYAGNLYLFITNQVNANATTYFPPRFDTALTNLGIGSVATIELVLSINVDHSPFPIPINIAPFFLPTLRDVFAIQVIEARSLAVPSIPPTTSRLVGLPGLVGVRRIVAPTGFNFELFTTLKVEGTAFKDLSSFSSLICPPSNINITNNSQLTSLKGIDNMATWTLNAFGPNVFIVGNNLTSAPSVSALSTLAGCPTSTLVGSTSPLSPFIQVIGCSFIDVCFSHTFYLFLHLLFL
jgi:hypothetical protein